MFGPQAQIVSTSTMPNIEHHLHKPLVFFSKPISVASDCNATPSCSALIFSM